MKFCTLFSISVIRFWKKTIGIVEAYSLNGVNEIPPQKKKFLENIFHPILEEKNGYS